MRSLLQSRSHKQKGVDKRGIRRFSNRMNQCVGHRDINLVPRRLPRSKDEDDIREGRKTTTKGGCRIMEINTDEIISTNGISLYLNVMERMKADIINTMWTQITRIKYRL